jgi:hypothetical protein
VEEIMSGQPEIERSAGSALQASRPPDFFIAGQAKSGTTALHYMLKQHPEIFMPHIKEPMFFARGDMPMRVQIPGKPSTLDEYLALFASATPQQRIGEASPIYLLSSTAATEIASLNPEAKIIAIFREPVSFLRAFHLQLLKSGDENVRDLATSLDLERERRHGREIPRRSRRPRVLLYSDHVRYTDQLERFHAVFPTDQVLVLIYEHFRSDNAGTVARILRFLGVDDSVPIPPVEANPTVSVRSRELNHAVRRIRDGRGPLSTVVHTGIKAVIPQATRRRLMQTVQTSVVQSAPPPVDEALAAELRTMLRPEVERLGRYLDLDLIETWGYGDA